MSNEIKVGDKVHVREDAPKIYTDGWIHDWRNADSIVKDVDNEDVVIVPITRDNCELAIPLRYIIKVEDEAKEPKFKYKEGDWVKMPDGDVAVIVKVNIDSSHPYDLKSVKTQGTSYSRWSESDLEPYTEPTEEVNLQDATREFVETHPFDIESLKHGRKVFEDMYWDSYTADLAKEIAVKVANKFNAPHEAAEYAVSVAKAVVEGLKRK